MTVDGFGQVNTLQSLLGGGLPVRRRIGDRGLERVVQDLRRRDPGYQGLDRIGEVVVLGVIAMGMVDAFLGVDGPKVAN